MDIAAILNVRALVPAIMVALGVLALAVILEYTIGGKSRAWVRLRGALVPLALAGGFLTYYGIQFDWPKSHDAVPWYLGESWKLSSAAAVAAGVLLAVGRATPRIVEYICWFVLAAVVVHLIVRGPWLEDADHPAWEIWKTLAWGMGAALLAYFIVLAPTVRAVVKKDSSAEPAASAPAVALLGPLVFWLTTSAAAVICLTWVDQRLGRLLVMLAVLAGMAIVVGIPGRLRWVAASAGPFLATMFAGVWTLVAFYDHGNDLPVVPSAMVLVAASPLGLVLTWIPAVRRRTWLAFVVTLVCAGVLIGVGAMIAAQHAPAVSE